MSWYLRALLAISVVAGCDEGDGNFEPAPITGSATPKASGFSADLAKAIGEEGKTEKIDTKTEKAEPETANTKTEKADPKADEKTDAKADPEVAKADTKPDKTDAKADTKPESPSEPPSAGSIKPPINLAAERVHIKPSPELAAIKLSLSPNWDRDVGEAGTISLVVKVPNKEATRVFAFRYGYEDAKAPSERDAYKKWLAENKIFTPKVDRQRGGAWYLEGEDASGPAFRILVNYGGKKLICGGSLYRDAQSSQLGDIRDKTVIQAKEICESLQL